MKTPNVQHIEDAVLAEFGGQVRAGAWLCRKIAGTFTWSQHAYTQENHLDPDFLGNAVDIFPNSMAIGDQVAAFIRSEFSEVIKVVLWRVKDHFDHVHSDTWPTGINLPPCKGGKLQVRHKDGRIGQEFTYEFGPPPLPPIPEPTPPIMEDVLLPLTPASSPQDIGRLQDLINETYYYPKGETGLTMRTPPNWGTGTSAAIRKWLVPKTNDTDPEVVAGNKVNYNQFNGLMKDWILTFTK